MAPALAGRFLTTEPSGKSHGVAFSALSLGPLPLPANFALCLNCILSVLLECAIFPTVLDHLISPTHIHCPGHIFALSLVTAFLPGCAFLFLEVVLFMFLWPQPALSPYPGSPPFIPFQVRYMKIIEKSGYQALPWVRYITQSGGKAARLPEMAGTRR